MERLYIFLIRNDVWIYILCGLGLVWYLAEFIRSRRILRSAMFGLERERGHRLRNRSLGLIFIFVLVSGAVTYVNIQIAPTLPAEMLRPPTPTPNIFATPLSSPTPSGSLQNNARATLDVAPTVTLRSSIDAQTQPDDRETETTGTPTPDSRPIVDFNSCEPNISISAPPSGSTTSGSITFFGRATGDNFGYFDLEAFGPSTEDSWISLTDGGVSEPIFDGILTTVDVSEWLSGEYVFRLVVFEPEESEIGSCAVQVFLDSDDS